MNSIGRLRADPKTSWIGAALLAAQAIVQSGALPEEYVATASSVNSAIASVALVLVAGDRSNEE